MNNTQKEKIFILAKYVDIIQSLVADSNNISILKLIVFSFILKNYNYSHPVFSSQIRKNLTSLVISLMKNDKNTFFMDIEDILDCLVLLEQNDLLKVNEGVVINKKCSVKIGNNTLFKMVTNCAKTDSDKFVLREVLNYV